MDFRKPQLNNVERLQLIEDYEGGMRIVDLVEKWQVTKATVHNIIKKMRIKKAVARKKYDVSNRFKLTEQDRQNIQNYLKSNRKDNHRGLDVAHKSDSDQRVYGKIRLSKLFGSKEEQVVAKTHRRSDVICE